jgi:hypothetical protein
MSDTETPDVEQQRVEVAETVDALRDKLDVPARGKAAVKNQVERLNENVALRNSLIVAATAVAVLFVAGRVRARRRR